MVYIKVQYDAYFGKFKLIDRGLRTLLEDEGVYELAIPLAQEEEFEPDTMVLVEQTMANA
jgi:hypothetical protein